MAASNQEKQRERWYKIPKRMPIRYESRFLIEEIMKDLNIDRSRFYEYSKTEYQKVLHHFYYAFLDHRGIPNRWGGSLHCAWLHLRETLKIAGAIYNPHGLFDIDGSGYVSMLHTIKERFQYDWSKKLFLILADGWVYEGYIDEMISVLCEFAHVRREDFFIVSPQYNRFILYCEDGDSLVSYEK